MQIEIIKSLLLALILGFLIGLQRSLTYKSTFAGSRSFALTSFLGYLSAWVNSFEKNFLIISFLAVTVFSLTAYFLKTKYTKQDGITTNIAYLITFIIGIMVYYKLPTYAIFTAITTIVILNIKPLLQKIETKITSKETNAAILLLVMSFLLLPILPNKTFFNLFNPYKTWLMAIIIASLSFIGYLGIKFFGKKGLLFTAAAGGFISSTAVTASFSAMYKESKTSLLTYLAGISIANTLMFARVFIESYITNPQLSKYLFLPYFIATVYGIFISYYFFKKSTKAVTFFNLLEKNPLELNEAIKFAIIFAIIYALIEYAHNNFGNTGIFIVSFISGFSDVDAITLSLGELSQKSISLKNASIGILIASLSNTITKFFIVLFFSKELAKKSLIFFLVESIILFSTLTLIKLS